MDMVERDKIGTWPHSVQDSLNRTRPSPQVTAARAAARKPSALRPGRAYVGYPGESESRSLSTPPIFIAGVPPCRRQRFIRCPSVDRTDAFRRGEKPPDGPINALRNAATSIRARSRALVGLGHSWRSKRPHGASDERPVLVGFTTVLQRRYGPGFPQIVEVAAGTSAPGPAESRSLALWSHPIRFAPDPGRLPMRLPCFTKKLFLYCSSAKERGTHGVHRHNKSAQNLVGVLAAQMASTGWPGSTGTSTPLTSNPRFTSPTP